MGKPQKNQSTLDSFIMKTSPRKSTVPQEASPSGTSTPSRAEMDPLDAAILAAAPKFTPVNAPVTAEREQYDETATDASQFITSMTDDEILTGSFSNFKGMSVLQIALTRTNKEIIAAWNNEHDGQGEQLSDNTVAQHLHRAKQAIAKQRGLDFETISSQVEGVRKANGVLDRKKKTVGRPRKNKTVDNSSAGQDAEEDESNNDEDESTQFIVQPPQDLQSDCDAILAEHPKLLKGGRLLKVASIYGNFEIVRKIDATHGAGTITSDTIGDRLRKAYVSEGEVNGQTADEVKEDLRQKRVRYGVKLRVDAHSSVQRQAAIRQNKQQKANAAALDTTSAASGAENGDDNDDEDPLADLEEVVRRDAEGTLELTDEDWAEFPQPTVDLTEDDEDDAYWAQFSGGNPQPMNFAPVGYRAGTAEYVSGFRTYDPDGSQKQ
jgi:hypothetical protein